MKDCGAFLKEKRGKREALEVKWVIEDSFSGLEKRSRRERRVGLSLECSDGADTSLEKGSSSWEKRLWGNSKSNHSPVAQGIGVELAAHWRTLRLWQAVVQAEQTEHGLGQSDPRLLPERSLVQDCLGRFTAHIWWFCLFWDHLQQILDRGEDL